MPISRQLLFQNEPSSSRLLPSSSVGSSTFDPATCIPENYIPSAVTLPTQQEMKASKHGLSSYFRELKRESGSQKPSTSTQLRQSDASEDINFSQAFQHLLEARGMEDRATIMKEIDEIMESYQGLRISPRSSDPWSQHQTGFASDGRRDTLTMLNAGPYSQAPLTPDREPLQMPRVLPPTPEEHGGYQQRPVFNSSIFDQQQEQMNLQQQQYPAKNPYPQMQTASQQPRWSTTSGTSSNFSASPSLDRNSSTSSQDSRTQNPPLPSQHSPRNPSPSIARNSMTPDSPLLYYDSTLR